MSERRRFALLAVVVVLVAAAAVLNAAFPRQRPQRVASAPVGQPSVAVSAASSSAWYCPGPLPVGARPETSAIAIANLTHRRLIGRLEVVRAGGSPSEQPVVVPAASQVVVPLAGAGAPGEAAASLLLDGSGTAVSEIVRGGLAGAQRAPCSTSPSTTAYLPAGSTKGAANIALSVYNPSATTAVADVAVTTGAGSQSPPALQGLIVGSGQLLVVDIGRQVPQQAVVATSVTTTAGEVVSGAQLVFPHLGGGTIDTLTAAAAQASATWWFAPAPVGPGTHEVFSVLDPGTSPAEVTLDLSGDSGQPPVVARVPAGGAVQLPVPSAAASSLCWAELTSDHGRAVVVARETLVDDQPLVVTPARPAGKQAAPSGHAPAGAAGKATTTTGRPTASSAAKLARSTTTTIARKRAKAVSTRTTTTLPARTPSGAPRQRPQGSLSAPVLASGATVAIGSGAPSSGWLLPADENDAGVAELVVVANPCRASASVQLLALPAPSSSAGAGASAAAAGSGTGAVGGPSGTSQPAVELSVGAGRVIAWAPPLQRPGAPPYGLVVRSSCAVVAAGFLYGRTAAGGLSSLSAVPIAG